MHQSLETRESVASAGRPVSPDRSAETTAAGIPWARFARERAAIRDRWPTVWDLPVRTSQLELLRSLARSARSASLLDVGATDRRHRDVIESMLPGVTYRSLDVDRSLPHDYHDFADVDRRFDVVTCIEVLEHVPHRIALDILRDCVRACRPGGHVLVSVPNCLVPAAQLEFGHVTAFSHRDLGGLCRIAGLEVVEMARVSFASPRRRWVHRRLLARWHRLMGTDWCSSIACLARRPAAAPVVDAGLVA